MDAPPESQLLVLAGPGTGKTFTLVNRVGELVEAGRSPLVLSFTRAVVREVHRRLAGRRQGAARYVRPVTFDSFATRLLSGLLIDEERWIAAGYDGRIAAAVAQLETSAEAETWVRDRFSHLVVDELQDLTGPRGHLVSVLCKLMSGFSLFGDPAQGIYGWQAGAKDYSSIDLLEDLRSSFPDLIVRELTINHRATTEERREVAALRSRLLDPEPSAATRRLLRQIVNESEPLGRLENAVELVGMLPGSTAILCRNNAEALTASERLWSAGVDHVLRRGFGDRAVAPWLAEIARGCRGALSRTSFEERYEAAEMRGELDASAAWEVLTTVSGDDDRVALDRVADAVRQGRLPDELAAPDDAALVVSTIHRAKGLEFDNVVLAQEPPWRTEVDEAEEARVLYVALTRARTTIAHLDAIDTSGWTLDKRTDRWCRAPWGKKWMTLGFELAPTDVSALYPAGALIEYDDVVAAQQRLAGAVRRGDTVRLRRIAVDDAAGQTPLFAIEHEAGLLGVTSDAFGGLLARRLGSREGVARRWPDSLAGARVDGIETVAGLSGVGAEHNLGNSGLWLRIRVVGLADVGWSKSAGDGEVTS